jgi:deoxyribodipyrimidine photo-lyase
VHWISEVLWREFYVNVMVGFPRVCMHRAFQLNTEAIVWNDEPNLLEAWKHGRTGVPIVDAGMRQLLRDGWMHNRVRMVVAMYFTKDYFLNWRLGEKWFMQNLIDGFLASNNGGWQWSASTGTDAAPYFRIFNTYNQSEKFDPDGAYIREFVPELRGVEGPAIHDPERLPGLLRSRLDYPKPLVDRVKAREKAIDAFRKLRPS